MSGVRPVLKCLPGRTERARLSNYEAINIGQAVPRCRFLGRIVLVFLMWKTVLAPWCLKSGRDVW
jgi:hypothetical protein